LFCSFTEIDFFSTSLDLEDEQAYQYFCKFPDIYGSIFKEICGPKRTAFMEKVVKNLRSFFLLEPKRLNSWNG